MELQIRPVDPGSSSDLAQLNALIEANSLHAYGGVAPTTIDQRRQKLASTPYWEQNLWVAVAETLEGGESIVGLADVMIPQKENLEMVHMGLEVHPAFRGHGVGTALVEEALLPAIRDSGRPLVTAYGEQPAEGDVDDPDLPVVRIAARLGISRKNVAICRVLDLPLEDSLLDELEAEATAKLDGYTILTWEDTVPEEHLAAYGALLRQLDIDDPDEDVENEPGVYTPERIRFNESRRVERGEHWIATVAVAPDGTLVGNSEMDFGVEPGTTLGWQGNTLVMPGHRGHRLGLALKVANHRTLARTAPHVRVLVTWNSHVNPWMIGINERLGYRVQFREVVFQGRRETD